MLTRYTVFGLTVVIPARAYLILNHIISLVTISTGLKGFSLESFRSDYRTPQGFIDQLTTPLLFLPDPKYELDQDSVRCTSDGLFNTHTLWRWCWRALSLPIDIACVI
jgi:hypothetical protein